MAVPPPEVELRLADGGDDEVEDVVRGALLRQRLVREHEAVPEGVLHERADVLREHVVAAVDDGKCPRRLDQRDRPTRARPVRISSPSWERP